MKYAVTSNVNGNFKIESEWDNNLTGARNSFWDKCKAYNSAPDVVTAVVKLIDERLDTVENKVEHISHEVEPNE